MKADARQLSPGKIVVASHNPGKIVEIAELLKPFGIDPISAADLDLPEPEETGLTFRDNAELKAMASATGANMIALADDSGLAVDALGGEPGIYSARWAGPGKNFMTAMEKIEHLLQEKQANNPSNRGAHFICALCLAWPDGHVEHFEGRISGTLVWPPRGDKGFGYDPVFQPAGFDQTFGEMPQNDKHAMSHRARAFELLTKACLANA